MSNPSQNHFCGQRDNTAPNRSITMKSNAVSSENMPGDILILRLDLSLFRVFPKEVLLGRQALCNNRAESVSCLQFSLVLVLLDRIGFYLPFTALKGFI